MDNIEDKLNTIAYLVTIIVEAIYIYVTNKKNISNEDKNTLVKLGRTLLFLVAIYFVINAFIGLNKISWSDGWWLITAWFRLAV